MVLPLLTNSELKGEAIRTVVGQGDLEIGPQLNGPPPLLLLPSLAHVFVVVQH